MVHFPALLDLATQRLHPLGVSASFLVGRNETADVCVFDPTCSRHHFRIVRRDGHHHVEPLSTRNPTYHNGRPVTVPEAVDHGSILQAGQTRFQFLLHAPREGLAPKVVNPPPLLADPPTIMAGLVPIGDDSLGTIAFPWTGADLIGREQGRVQVYLPHPQVSRRHACIVLQGPTATLTDLHSATSLSGCRPTRGPGRPWRSCRPAGPAVGCGCSSAKPGC
jgi:pSer/pThr/pTyr-binding forkhead associated (FHA) protein